jgi:hypothetical protein
VDFAPTVLNLAGVELPEHFAGKPFMGPDSEVESRYVFGARSRADDIYEVSRCVLDDQFIYIRHFMPHQSYVTEAIIFNDSKAGFRELSRLRAEGKLNPEAEKFWQPKAYEELYDLEADPHELNNLAGDPAYVSKKKEMQDVLYNWMQEHRDVGLLHESEMMNRSRGSSPYEMGASEAYPVEEVLKAANLCGKPDATLDEITGLLDHPDSGVRYWAVLGFYAAGEVNPEVKDKLTEMIQDPSPTVALAAAELICHMGRYDRGIPVIADGLRDADHPTRVLQAAIAARNLKAYASELLPVIEEIYPAYRGEVWDRYRDWVYPMFIGFALDQTYLNCGLEIPE